MRTAGRTNGKGGGSAGGGGPEVVEVAVKGKWGRQTRRENAGVRRTLPPRPQNRPRCGGLREAYLGAISAPVARR